ncbi:Hypothetical predicted protein [Mytilus galloprovincialis]|uniref:Uncharacterized protein n=1 Tax=Mytilus galloprovincialis TaxID=29158 RepID=A0A8B6GAY6_MYTGA|nr:Hypothetical predicted protein [Mytilus galloprovincialis]
MYMCMIDDRLLIVFQGQTPYDTVTMTSYCSEEKKKEVMDFLKDIDDDREDGEVKRPFRRRTLSISSRVSRLSTASVSSTARPLAATTPTTPIDFPDDISQDSFRTDGTSHINRPMYRRQQSSEMRDQMQILEYASSPLAERRFRTF